MKFVLNQKIWLEPQLHTQLVENPVVSRSFIYVIRNENRSFIYVIRNENDNANFIMRI